MVNIIQESSLYVDELFITDDDELFVTTYMGNCGGLLNLQEYRNTGLVTFRSRMDLIFNRSLIECRDDVALGLI